MSDKTDWVALPGYKGVYEVSSTGSVRRVDTGRVLTIQRSGTPAARVRLSRDGKERSMRVDELIKLAQRASRPATRKSRARKTS